MTVEPAMSESQLFFYTVPDDGCNVYLSSLAPCSFASFCIDVSQNTFSESTLLWAYHVTVAVMVSWFGLASYHFAINQ